ncbi:MAG: penicillin-binding transpeptidase domain-containing protein [Alphaproteobacteria bacterium]
MISSLARFVIVCAVALAALAGAGLRLENLFAAGLEAPGGEKKNAKKTEDRELFLALIRNRVIQPRPDGGLHVLAPDYFLVQRAEGRLAKLSKIQLKARKNRRRLHGILYFAPVGSLVRAQVKLWNDTRYMAAIRDNRTRPPGDFTNDWTVYSAKGHPLRSGSLVPENFGFVLDGQLTAGYSDWAAVSRRGQTVTFRTTIHPTRASVLSVQVAGQPISWTPRNAKVTQLDGKSQFGCGEAKGGQLRFALKPTAQPITISVTVRPSVNCERKINGLAIRQTKDAVGQYTAFDWRPIKRSRGGVSSFVITTRDGVALTDPGGKGTPTQAAYDLGLVPIIGFGPAATFSLAGMMAASKLPPQGVSVALTIDSKVQAAAQKAVLAQIKRMGASGRYAKKRKAAVVVLDADTGAIVAVASYPLVPSGARPWDYAAFGAAFPLRDPSTVIAWGIIDQNNSPGSTFKPVVALSVMHSAKGSEIEKFRRAIKGLTAGEIGSVMGLQAGQSSYAPTATGTRSISNFGNGGMGPFGGRSRSPACTKQQPLAPPTFGLRQAVQHSVNVWFARISVMLDEARIEKIVNEIVASKRKGLFRLGKSSRLIEAARWLGIDDLKRMDLASNLPPGVVLQRFNTGLSADVLFPQVAKQAFTNIEIYAVPGARATLRHISALNGIGQSVSVHPLHMARAATAVASGKLILPYIFHAWGGRELMPPPSRRLGIDPELLQVLRNGMKAVPEISTAARAFGPTGKLKCRAYGKTGTAEIVKKTGQHSAWFIGWREPETPANLRDKSKAKDRRLSYACMVTHGFGGFRTGGSSCAPIVRDILVAIEAEGKKKKEKKKKRVRRRRRQN